MGSGWVRQVPRTSSRPVVHGLGQQAQHPEAGPVGPVQVVEHHDDGLVAAPLRRPGRRSASQVRNSAPSSSASPYGEVGAEAAQHLLPRPQRRRAVVLRAAADERPGRRRPRRGPPSSPHSRDLPMPGSPGERGEARRRPARRRRSASTSDRELVVAADQRPVRQRAATARAVARCRRRAGRRRAGPAWPPGWPRRAPGPGAAPRSAGRAARRWARARARGRARRAPRGGRPGRRPGDRPGPAPRPAGPTAARAAGTPRSAPRARPRRSRGRRARARRTARSSRATLRSSSSRARSATADGASSSSTYGIPRHSASASSSSREARRDRVVGQARAAPTSVPRVPSRRCTPLTARSNRAASRSSVGHAQGVAGGDGHQHAWPAPAAPGRARGPGAARRRRPGACRRRRPGGESAQSRSTSASTETGRPPDSASAATSARRLRVPRSTRWSSRHTSVAPSTHTRTARGYGGGTDESAFSARSSPV